MRSIVLICFINIFIIMGQITVGRGLNVTYQLLSTINPLMISRLHCTFKQRENGKWTVTDQKVFPSHLVFYSTFNQTRSTKCTVILNLAHFSPESQWCLGEWEAHTGRDTTSPRVRGLASTGCCVQRHRRT